jgi:hypothetical protein
MRTQFSNRTTFLVHQQRRLAFVERAAGCPASSISHNTRRTPVQSRTCNPILSSKPCGSYPGIKDWSGVECKEILRPGYCPGNRPCVLGIMLCPMEASVEAKSWYTICVQVIYISFYLYPRSKLVDTRPGYCQVVVS